MSQYCRGITIKGVTHQIMPLKVIYKATFGEGLAPEESVGGVVCHWHLANFVIVHRFVI